MSAPVCPPSQYAAADQQAAWAQSAAQGVSQQYAGQPACPHGYYGQDAQAYAQQATQGAAGAPTQEQLRQQYEHMQQAYEEECSRQASAGAQPQASVVSQSMYLPQPAMYGHMTKPVPMGDFHPGYNYAPGINVHYNYYEASEYVAKVDRPPTAEEPAKAEADAEKDAKKEQEQALKPLITSKFRLASGQAYVN
ncbi:hypothetical protein BESB_049140 [Besnoitia besnoiti]|uniref:Uncharacterized protein n=1 Tax=Besnoitia besnoiti TaxID=94643 RepID=A0A2A9MMF9_BESBE|nr:hypothetical protein BESB_049140 [Besnoitia besnoiti]PFH36722.1 hypothetical protein BESB_049140 [Besnoitia besnoiti]